MPRHYGDFFVGDTVFMYDTFVDTNGAPATPGVSPAASVYQDGSLTETTAGVTLTAGFDGRPGLVVITIASAAASGFYATGREFHVVMTAGTVGAVALNGYVFGAFALENRAVLRPTVADRTLDVNAAGEAGLDWANIGSPTTAVNLSQTQIATVGAVTLRVTANTDQIEGLDATNQIRDSILTDATRFAGASIDAAITSRLAPTVAGRTLDVTATGAAGVDWANVEAQATAVNLSATTVSGVSAAGANMIADHTLRRSFVNARTSGSGDAASFRSLLGAVAKLVNRVFESSATNLRTTQEDDLTAFGNQTITTTGTAVTWTDLDTV